jgi:hypothetical protein
VPSLGNWLL